jgi:ABC-type branched-subunit amino acid transport system substrate-binding protein/tRNA A-37 threonylcarbamoyl transferase component Bud32
LPVSADARIGTEVLGYRIEALLGRGGMSVVYRAEDLRLKRRVALKLMAPELAGDERFRERFLRESELAASIDHPSIVPIYEAGEVDGQLYIAMRYVEGTDLKALLREERPLEPGRALALLEQVGDALDAAHRRGLVHRDVKPANVLVAAEAGREHCYLSDFGLTKQASSESGLTESGQFVGTAEYIAPEQIERGRVDGRADLYSLGCILYQCLTGEVPYPGERLMAVLWAHVNEPPPAASERNPGLPAAIDTVIAKALAKAPEQRYPSCAELIDAAREALPAPENAPAPARRRLRRALIAGALVAAAAAVATGLLLTRGGGGARAGAGASSDSDAIVIGMTAAKTGLGAGVDSPTAKAFMMRIDEINQAGGVLGKRVDVTWLDSKSDLKTTARNADALVSRKAVAIVAPCDLQYGLPALNVARRRNVLGISICAAPPSAADPSVVGPYGGTMDKGADAEGAGMAEWLRQNRPQWKRAYVVRDGSGLWSAMEADYFAARWKQLGGTISGEDTFPGSASSDPDLTQQVLDLHAKVDKTDVIYDGPSGSVGATFIRQTRAAGIDLPIATNGSIDKSAIRDFAAGVSNVYLASSVCVPSYCRDAVGPYWQGIFESFYEKYLPIDPATAYSYDLATVLVEAIKRAKSTDSTKIAKALFSGFTIQTLLGPVKFTEKCHRPQPPSHIFELYTNGKAKALGLASTRNIPDIGDGNPCAGPQANP